MENLNNENIDGLLSDNIPALGAVLGLDSSDIQDILKDQFGASFSDNSGIDKLMDVLIN